MTLAEFLLARIAEDEAVAREPETWAAHDVSNTGRGTEVSYLAHVSDVPDRGYYVIFHEAVWTPTVDHMARWDPARVLAECAVRRDLVAALAPYCWGQFCTDNTCDRVGCRTLRILARPYADHADYLPGWAT